MLGEEVVRMPIPGHPVLAGRESAYESVGTSADHSESESPRETLSDSLSDSLSDVLALLPIDGEAWRLCDRRQREDDAAFVVAYVERTERELEVIWMTGVPRRSRFSTVEAVRDEACRRLGAEVASGATRPVPIPHFPPPQG
jgi:hypothetical protein